MDAIADDDLLLGAVDAIVLDVLRRIGRDPKARFSLSQTLLGVAQGIVAPLGPEASQKPQ